MRKCASLIFCLTLLSAITAHAEESFTPFTGQILRDKVRLRVQPNLEAPIIRELAKEEMVIVTGENEEFYSIQPPKDFKNYIYRTFVLDGVVEGTNVNVRLQPDVESPVLTQLNSGDRVIGQINEDHSKWLEIVPPAGVQFYIAKDYVKKVGDAGLIVNMNKRRNEVTHLLDATQSLGIIEIEKPFQNIQLDDINANLDAIINDYPEYPEQVEKARQFKAELNDRYIQKQIAYLENKAQGEVQHKQLIEKATKQPLPKTPVTQAPKSNVGNDQWISNEELIFEEWSTGNPEKTVHEFYESEREQAVTLQGIIEPYQRAVRNKPGDFVLLNRVNRLPVAFLYSTEIDLTNYEDQEVTVRGVERPNNNFAFPAYFVLSVE